MATTTETTEPNVNAGAIAAAVSLVGAIVAFFLTGGFPNLATNADVLPFGGWLMKFGLLLAVIGFVFATAAAFATALATTTKTTKTDPPASAEEGVAAAGAVTTTTATGLLKDLIGVAAALVAQPAGVGAFVMLIGAVLVVGTAFAD